jgi:hypothetical protein
MTFTQRLPLARGSGAVSARENQQKSPRNLGQLEVLLCMDNNSALLKYAASVFAHELSKLAAHRMNRYQM